MEVVVNRFLDICKKNIMEAQKKYNLDDLDGSFADEVLSADDILMSTVLGEDDPRRIKSEKVYPLIKFYWDNLRGILDLLKVNSTMEELYHSVCEQAFEFCLSYNRVAEFRALRRYLHKHLEYLMEPPQDQASAKFRVTWCEKTATLQMKTRFLQFDAACKLNLWTEASLILSDVHIIMMIPSWDLSLLKGYYDRLSKLFWEFKNYFYMDAYFKGIYTPSVMSYLHRQHLDFEIQDGDMDIIAEGARCFDFLGVNYYQSQCVEAAAPGAARRYKQNNKIGKGGHVTYEIQPDLFQGCKNEFIGETDFSMPIDPSGLQYMLEDIYDRYGKPIMVCENGFGGYDTLEKDGSIHDPYRIEYLREHIKAIGRAIDNGVEMLGYNPWSAIDLLSTSNGIAKRYGFVYVDRTDDDVRECKRYRKDSFWWYKNVIATNGANLE